MKKSLLLIALCLLFAVSCNQSNKAGQQKENAEPVETVQQDQDFNLFSLEDFVDLINNDDEATAAKCGMTFLYEGEIEDDMEGEEGVEGDIEDAGFYVVAFGKDVKKGEQEWNYQGTSDHAYFYEVSVATSINQDLCFVNQKDANAFYEKLSKQEVVKGEREFSVTQKENNLGGQYLLLEAMDDSGDIFSVDPPELMDGFYVIAIYKYV